MEFKHQNISAVLISLGQPYVKGYLPRYNYQNTLETEVIKYFSNNPGLESLILHFVNAELNPPKFEKDYFERVLVSPPRTNFVGEPKPTYDRHPIKVNYLEREQQNTQLGESGEKFILEYEKWRLNKLGKDSLADQVVWVSKEDGDGAGFDILSKNENGSDRYIEVKTTKLGKETPFYFTRNELKFSETKSKDFHLFRLFDFRDNPRLFIKNGSLGEICYSTPMTFKGSF